MSNPQPSLRTVLLVEDNADIRDLVEISLAELGGLVVITAASGREALDIVAHVMPDLVLLDYMLPGLDGSQIIRALQDTAATANLPVAFLTAKTQPHEVADMMALGAIGVIAKPFSPITLADQLRTLWTTHHDRG
jgi:two-component system, OmpR family, response regulator